MSVKFPNNGHSTLASSLTTSATSITVASGHGARFPSLTGSEYFYATLIDSSNNLEIVKVTARSSDVLTVTRAQESTTARAYAVGDRVELRITAQGLVDVGTPAADSITNAMLADEAVDTPQIADDAITDALIDDNAVGAAALNVSGNGSSGQALLSDGDGTMSWGSSGGIAQFKHTQVSTQQTHASSSYTTLTGVTATLTPASTSSKVYVMFGIHGKLEGSNRGWRVKIQRVIGGSATDVFEEADQKAVYVNGTSAQWYGRVPYAYLDSPNTTSAVTYQAQVYTDGNATVNYNTAGASYVTIMEVTV